MGSMHGKQTDEVVRVVHLEDDPRDRELVHLTLDEGEVPCSIVDVGTREEFTSALEKGPVDLILSDFTLPGFNGLAALEIARRIVPGVPFVFVTGSMGEEAAIETLRGGATDYVLKHRLARLVPAVHRALQEAVERRTRSAAEVALARERGFLLALLDSLEAGVVACDDQGRVTLVNRATRELHGLSSDDAEQEWLEKPRLLAGDGKTPLTPEEFPLRRALRGEVLRNLEINIRRNAGDVRVAQVGGQPILDGAGNKLGAVVALHDVTDHKELERQFRQSQKMEAMGVLAAGVAHDFNNLLTAIMGFGQLLKLRLPSDSAESADVAEILSASERAAGLTRQLLAFTRQQVLQPRVLDLNEVIHGLEKMLRRLIGEDIELHTILAENLGSVTADPGQLEQVLVNLAVNARDAMSRGGRLTIQTCNVDPDATSTGAGGEAAPEGRVRLRVSDTGCGMSRDVMTRIFEPFFTTKEVGKGTGLGLSTVLGIVKQSGGQIEVDSEPGRGTTFTIEFTRTPRAVATAPARAAIDDARGRGETLLLVEDEPGVRRILGESLRRAGYQVIEAANGREALDRFAKLDRPIDLLVTDVVLPLLGGPELAAQLAETCPSLRTLFISGYADRSLVSRGVALNNALFLQKPFTPDVLVQRVREALDGPQTKAA
jgi:PAS domain S-box-containing protein